MSWHELIENAILIRRQLHMIPEPCWQEVATSTAVTQRLDQLGISWRQCAKTGIVANVAQGRKGDHLALRADMDGLVLTEAVDVPWKSTKKGVMHGCGHDGHMAALLATAEWLNLHEAALPGPVTFLFQPAEEGGHGARAMIADGALEGIDRIFGWHNWPTIPFGRAICPAGPVMAANASFKIVISGSGGHASQPELCKDPVLAAAALTLGLQQIVSRRLPPQQAAVVSVTSIDSRSAETVIPDQAVLAGSVRMEKTGDLQLVGELIESTSQSIAAGYNVAAEVEFSHRYPAVVNDPIQAAVVQGILDEVLGASWLHKETNVPLMASEDFSYYLEKVPGAFAIAGAGDGSSFAVPCHNSRYIFNDHLIEPMVRVMVMIAGCRIP
ncbi:MAG: N(2)-acetyl-L-2,4-diaminobutanoate deacetylase DoeB2 [Desulforhopalus sp.]